MRAGPVAPYKTRAMTETGNLRMWAQLRSRESGGPLTWLAACGTVVLLAIGLCTWLALHEPALGLRLAPAERGLRVLSVDADGPAAGKLAPGDRLVALGSPRTPLLPLHAQALAMHPERVARYADQQRFLQDQTALHAALREPQVTLALADGRRATLAPAPHRTIDALPAAYWIPLACGAIAFLAGVLVCAFRREQPAAIYYALTGIGLFVAGVARALAAARELALDGAWLGLLFKLEYLGLDILWWGLMATLWYYPAPLGRMAFGRWLGLPFLAIWAWDFFEVPQTLHFGRRVPLILGFASAAIVALLQWRRTRAQPVEAAALRWLLLAWFSGTGFFVATVLVPPLLGLAPPVDGATSFAVLLTLHVGVALGILRYRLFDLDRWAMLVWLWFVGGLVVIAADAILVYLLQVNQVVALSVSLIFVGWVYFPMRQLMWERLGWTPAKVDFQKLFPDLLAALLAPRPRRPIEAEWRALLHRLYRPLALRAPARAPEAIRREEHGLRLAVPGFDGVAALEIAGAQHGTRLMGPEDERFVAGLRQLFASVQSFRSSFEQGVAQERARVARDLHDDIASDLLPVIYEVQDPDTRHRLQAIFAELRAIMQGMDAPPRALTTLCEQWESECRARCAAQDVVLDWQATADADLELSSRPAMNLRGIVKEAVSNALRHAQASTIRVRVAQEHAVLRLSVEDNGRGCDGEPRAGRGLRNMRARAAEIGGEIRWAPDRSGCGTRVELRVPISDLHS